MVTKTIHVLLLTVTPNASSWGELENLGKKHVAIFPGMSEFNHGHPRSPEQCLHGKANAGTRATMIGRSVVEDSLRMSTKYAERNTIRLDTVLF